MTRQEKKKKKKQKKIKIKKKRKIFSFSNIQYFKTQCCFLRSIINNISFCQNAFVECLDMRLPYFVK